MNIRTQTSLQLIMNSLRVLAWGSVTTSRRSLLKYGSCQDGSKRFTSTTESTEDPPREQISTKFSIPKGILGQPTFHTHPHLLQPGHLTSGITQAEYKERRDILISKLAIEADNPHRTHIIVIPAARKQYMSDMIPYPFRQNSDFYYLTGCMEPSAILMMIKPAETEDYKSILFVHDKDDHAELWEGPRTGCMASTELFSVDEAQPVDGFASYLNKLCTTKASTLWYSNDSPINPEVEPAVKSALRPGTVSLADPSRVLHFMRVVKSPAEIELMKETCYIGSQSMNVAMACTKPGTSESAIHAVLEYAVRQAGAEHLAFPPVVAGGPRATHIHYVSNNQLLTSMDMLLVDSGSQRWLYNSDISRTWPVSGKFSNYQRILYEIVLAVQKRLIQLLGEQRVSLDQLFEQMCRLLGATLQREGVLARDIDSHQLLGKAYRLCPHHVSHYLGLDVHDAPLVKRHGPVLPNMVVTVEPGIYIRPDDTSVAEEFRGIGIRIEDDVLITENDPVVLTESCAKEVSDVEALVGKTST